jgi:hypothetical protein
MSLLQTSAGAARHRFESAPQEKALEPFLWKMLVLTALLYLVWGDNFTLQIGLVSVQKSEVQKQFLRGKAEMLGLLGFEDSVKTASTKEGAAVDNLSCLLDPAFVRRHHLTAAAVEAQEQRCEAFVRQFAPVAIAEMRQYGVPASLLLAQALLASNAGETSAAKETNNFFLRACSETDCAGIHQALAVEHLETSYLEVEVYPNLWGSFRDQSLYFRENAPYYELIKTGNVDLKHWTSLLDAAGYAPDPGYGAQLLTLIKRLRLDKLDKRAISTFF